MAKYCLSPCGEICSYSLEKRQFTSYPDCCPNYQSYQQLSPFYFKNDSDYKAFCQALERSTLQEQELQCNILVYMPVQVSMKMSDCKQYICCKVQPTKKRMGRPPLGEVAQTGAQRQAKHKKKQKNSAGILNLAEWGFQPISNADYNSTEAGNHLSENALMWSILSLVKANAEHFLDSLVVLLSWIPDNHLFSYHFSNLHDGITQILFPTNLGNYHWILLRLLRKQDEVKFQIFDYLSTDKNGSAPHTESIKKAILERLQIIAETKSATWRAALRRDIKQESICVSQAATSDCGVHVFNQICVCCNLAKDLGRDMSQTRNWIQMNVRRLKPSEGFQFSNFGTELNEEEFMEHYNKNNRITSLAELSDDVIQSYRSGFGEQFEI